MGKYCREMFGSLDLLQLLNSALCFAPERVCDQHRPPFQPPLTVHHQFVLFASLPCLEKSYRSPHPPLIPLPLQLCCDCLFALLKPFFASPFKIILSGIELDQKNRNDSTCKFAARKKINSSFTPWTIFCLRKKGLISRMPATFNLAGYNWSWKGFILNSSYQSQPAVVYFFKLVFFLA